VSLVNP